MSRTCTTPTNATVSTTQVADSVLVELDPTGHQVWAWDSKNHVDIAAETKHAICFRAATTSNPNVDWALDYQHINSVDRFANGDYLISARHADAIYAIHRGADDAASKVLWKIGGAAPKASRVRSISPCST
ncbi:MAG: arylsulfotransferase family protein [Ilumatobacteraceae bacterium]